VHRLLPLLLLLLIAAPARAATTLVFFDPGEDSEAALSEVRAAWRAQKGRFALQVVEFRPLGKLLPPAKRLFLIGPARAVRCEEEFPVSAEAFTNLVREGGGSLAYLEFDRVQQTLDLARRSLPCLSGVAERPSLSRYHLLRGVSAFYSQGRKAARDEFRRGLLVSPFLQWDDHLPPDAEEVFVDAVSDALRTGRGMLSISPGVVTEGTLWIDGEPVDPRTRTRDLFEGLHLLQWSTSDRFSTLQIPVEAGQGLGLAHRSDLLLALTSRDADRLTEGWIADRLDLEARGGGFIEVVVAAPDAEHVLFHRYEPRNRTWDEARASELRMQIERGRLMRDQGLVIGLGGVAVTLLGMGMTWAGLVNGLQRPAEALSATVGLVLVGVGGTGLLIGVPVFARGSAMARGRDREEFLRYRALAREAGEPDLPVEGPKEQETSIVD
jgi:hypothetical protein